MTELPTSTAKKLGLVIDLDTCVGCHACVISCKGWNTENYGSNVSILTAERGGMDLMPEQGTKPVNKYLPPRPKDEAPEFDVLAPYLEPIAQDAKGFVGWLDKALSAMPGGAK